MESCILKTLKYAITKTNQNKKVLITSALPYVNNVPHLGNVIGCVLSADVFARFKRSMGYQVLYICGTDQYGTASQVKALQQSLTPKQLCDKYHALHANAYKYLDISFDHFGRTSTPSHSNITQQIFTSLDKNGYIKPLKHSQHYCPKCTLHLSDRFVKGQCPSCSAQTKGDQCDSCGALFEALEIVNPKCAICSSAPEIKTTEHLALDLPKIQPKLKMWMAERLPNWSGKAQGITNGWLKMGLKERTITRKLRWGVPVRKEGYQGLVFYVWFDAPIGYISMTQEMLGEKYKEWWMNAENTDLYQFMGKDNVPFHALMFPSSLLGTHLPYTTVTHICSTQYLLFQGKKFSKSNKIGVFCDSLPTLPLSPSVWRYYLLSIRPQNSDSYFQWDDFAHKINSELLANIGNLFNRILSFSFAKMRNTQLKVEIGERELRFLREAEKVFEGFVEGMEGVGVKVGLGKVNELAGLGNKYMQENAPWEKSRMGNGDSVRTVGLLVAYLRFLLAVLEPFVPGLCGEASKFMKIDQPPRLKNYLGTFDDFCNAFVNTPINNTEFLKPVPLVKEFSKEEKEKLRAQFSPPKV